MECCESKVRGLEVETDARIYEVVFGQIQIEITGRCNLCCQHCRAAGERALDMPIDEVVKVVRFARRYSPSYKEVVLSGGEPLLHHDISALLAEVRAAGGRSVSLTTNGTLLAAKHLELIASLGFDRFMLSISLDSLDPAEHDGFRGRGGAFEAAVRAIDLAVGSSVPSLLVSVRTTIRPHQIGKLEPIASFAYAKGCSRVSLSAIHPSGRALSRPDLWMTPEQKRRFIEEVYRLKGLYPGTFQVSTNDPLKCLVRDYADIRGEGELVFDGCVAGTVSFNISADGTMTPCALMGLPMMNISGMTVEQMAETYRTNLVVHNMLDMNLKGKCGKCSRKYQCGGCRARALGRSGDYLGEDPDCWL